MLAVHESAMTPLPAGVALNPVGAVGALVPVPERGTVSGELVSLLVMDSVPDTAPADAGVKVTEIVHEAPAARVLPQLLV